MSGSPCVAELVVPGTESKTVSVVFSSGEHWEARPTTQISGVPQWVASWVEPIPFQAVVSFISKGGRWTSSWLSTTTSHSWCACRRDHDIQRPARWRPRPPRYRIGAFGAQAGVLCSDGRRVRIGPGGVRRGNTRNSQPPAEFTSGEAPYYARTRVFRAVLARFLYSSVFVRQPE
jgi:hypothetical protein